MINTKSVKFEIVKFIKNYNFKWKFFWILIIQLKIFPISFGFFFKNFIFFYELYIIYCLLLINKLYFAILYKNNDLLMDYF